MNGSRESLSGKALEKFWQWSGLHPFSNYLPIVDAGAKQRIFSRVDDVALGEMEGLFVQQ